MQFFGKHVTFFISNFYRENSSLSILENLAVLELYAAADLRRSRLVNFTLMTTKTSSSN